MATRYRAAPTLQSLKRCRAANGIVVHEHVYNACPRLTPHRTYQLVNRKPLALEGQAESNRCHGANNLFLVLTMRLSPLAFLRNDSRSRRPPSGSVTIVLHCDFHCHRFTCRRIARTNSLQHYRFPDSQIVPLRPMTRHPILSSQNLSSASPKIFSKPARPRPR